MMNQHQITRGEPQELTKDISFVEPISSNYWATVSLEEAIASRSSYSIRANWAVCIGALVYLSAW
jgi:hypothetical protein